MKKLARSLIVAVLGWQVRRLRKKNKFQIVGVVGSIGKTSTKTAIANVLKQGLRVRYQDGNYNDLVTVPLIFFGLNEPSLFNPFAWLSTIMNIEKQLGKPYPYDAVVVEIGTDGPNQISKFGRYLRCDVTVLSAISLEHMEFFKDLAEVAKEELSVSKYSERLVINSDLSDSQYLTGADLKFQTFGTAIDVDYHITSLNLRDGQAEFKVLQKGGEPIDLKMSAIAMGEVYSATAATIVAEQLGVGPKDIVNGVAKLTAVSGRMQQLKGIKGSLLIDESYNSSPEAATEALDTLYRLSSPQKIAVLGNMNELGSYSEQAHKDIGKYCDPKQLDLVITIGPDANKYLAPAAESNGCQVLTFSDPFLLGEKLRDIIKDKTIVLFKGSQNSVFLEESIKPVLADPNDASLLVRQSPYWMAKKQSLKSSR